MLSYTSKGTGEGEAVAAATENILFSGVVYLSPHNTNYPQCSNHTKAGHLCCVVCCVFFFSVCFTLNVILLYSSFDSSIHWRNNEKKVNGCNKAFFFFFFFERVHMQAGEDTLTGRSTHSQLLRIVRQGWF